MKHFWAGILLLSLLLGVGLWSSHTLEQIHTPMETRLNRAAEAAVAGNWAQALDLAAQSAAAWQKNRNRVAALADHDAIEQIDSLFRQLEVYGTFRDGETYAATCRQLACLAAATAEEHQFKWWNLL